MNQSKKPKIFDVKDQTFKVTEEPEIYDNTSLKNNGQENEFKTENQTTEIPLGARAGKTLNTKLLSWGLLLFTSLFGLFTLWLTATLITSVEQLFQRNDIIGWLALGLTTLLIISILAIITKEIVSLSKLKKLGNLKTKGQQIHDNNELKPAKKYARNIKQLYEHTPKREWILKSLKDQEQTIMDGRELVELIDTEIGSPLDKEAEKIISETAKKVSVITAIAPGPFIDMVAVTLLNLTMIRKISTVYGVRPGLWGLSRLGRNILAHLALSGGLAMTGDLLQPLIGSSIAAKLSKKLGEGMINGALTIRIGLSAQEVTRPIPYITAKKSSFAKIVSSSLTYSSN
jgi:putative membrane protein